ncbi:MAG: hypothetical protein M3255_01565 [Pseudomonadota bacterium]|nr:hypothetical protein [Pseudomonadota bacterium]
MNTMTYSPLSLSQLKLALLKWEVRAIEAYLGEFDQPTSGGRRRARLSPSGEIILIANFPIPDGYEPDQINLLVGVSKYPEWPPIGLYIMNQGNDALIAQLRKRFSAFQDGAGHSADPVPGYTWLCYSYTNNKWRYCTPYPSRGDNVRKFLATFFALCAK